MIVSDSKPLYEGRRVSREQYLDLPADGFQYDMIDGVLHISPGAGSDHGHCTAKVSYTIMKFLSENPTGKLYSELDILLPDGGDVLRPDLTFVRNENLNIVLKHIHGSPDLVVEILSESTRNRDLTEKRARYESNGVSEYWIIDPEKKTFEILVLKNGSYEKSDTDASEVLPGLTLHQPDLF